MDSQREGTLNTGRHKQNQPLSVAPLSTKYSGSNSDTLVGSGYGPSRPARFAAGLGIGLIFFLITLTFLWLNGPKSQGGDFTYPWLAARAVLRGQDAYAYVRHSTTPNAPVLFYPLPAALVVMPLAWLPAQIAGALFVGLGCGLLAFAVTRSGWWPLLMFASAPAYRVAWSVQWSPLLMAVSILTPGLGLLVCKPNLALPLLVYQKRVRSVIVAATGGVILLALSLILQPAWPISWLAELRQNPYAGQYQFPIASRWGFILALAALKWRRRDAWFLLAMACVPQNAFFYDQFPLWLIPQSAGEMLFASTASVMALLIPLFVWIHGRTAAEHSAAYMPLMLIGAYLPALAMVLRRPNRQPESGESAADRAEAFGGRVKSRRIKDENSDLS